MNEDIVIVRKVREEADRQIAKYFEMRMNAAAKVAAYKKEFGIPIEDTAQEAKVIERNMGFIENEDLKKYFYYVTESLITQSKKYQYLLNEGMRIAYNGTLGAFAYIAAKRVFPGANLIAYGSFDDAYNAVSAGDCDLAVLPVETAQPEK